MVMSNRDARNQQLYRENNDEETAALLGLAGLGAGLWLLSRGKGGGIADDVVKPSTPKTSTPAPQQQMETKTIDLPHIQHGTQNDIDQFISQYQGLDDPAKSLVAKNKRRMEIQQAALE